MTALQSQDAFPFSFHGELIPWLEYLPQDVLSFFGEHQNYTSLVSPEDGANPTPRPPPQQWPSFVNINFTFRILAFHGTFQWGRWVKCLWRPAGVRAWCNVHSAAFHLDCFLVCGICLVMNWSGTWYLFCFYLKFCNDHFYFYDSAISHSVPLKRCAVKWVLVYGFCILLVMTTRMLVFLF